MLKRALLASLLLLSACGDQGDKVIASSSGTQDDCNTRTNAQIGGPFSLINQDGVRMTQADFKGHPTLVFFGFTYCPDVCPFALNKIEQAIQRLPADLEPPTTIMISVDPERDTPEQLKLYLSNDGFPKDIVGLTGTEEELTAASKAFIAYYKRIEDDTSAAGYTMSHSSLIYLMDEDWQMKTFFTHEAHPDDMASCLAQFLPEKAS